MWKVILLVMIILSVALTLLGSTYVMIIAVGEYKDGKFYDLKTALQSGENVKKLFEDIVIGENKLLFLKNPTKNEIIVNIKNFLKGKKDTDLLILYYTGHGFLKGNKIYLTASDTFFSELEKTSIDIASVLQQNISGNLKMLVILDTCGDLLREETKSALKDVWISQKNKDIEELVKKGVNFLFSTDRNEKSIGDYFTKYLIEGFKGKADKNGDRWIELKEIGDYVHDKVVLNTGHKQHPYYRGDPQFKIMKVGLGTLIVRAVNELAKTGEIFINGEKIGDLSTGKFERKLPVGMYKLVVKSEQMEEYEKDIIITSSSICRENILARKRMCPLTIESEPKDASVYIDNVYRGRTPLTVKLEYGKEYTIELRKKGYKPDVVSLKASEETKMLSITLAESKPPSIPEKISPISELISTKQPVILSWKAFDPEGEDLSYDLYFGSIPSPPLYKKNLKINNVVISNLASGQTYYWKVVAKDSCGNETSSPVWSFKTKSICTLTIVSQPIGNIPIKINGEEVFTPFKGSFEVGEEIEVKAPDTVDFSNTKYIFNRWSDECDEVKRRIVLNKSKDLKINYLRLYFINVKVEGQGSVKPSKIWIREGSDLVIRAFPEDGWEFVKWKVIKNGKVEYFMNPVMTVQNIDSPLEILAVFKTINKPPVVDIPDSFEVMEGKSLKIDLNMYCYDPDGDALRYRIVDGVGKVENGKYIYEPGFDEAGEYHVKISVSDGEKETTASFLVKVKDVNRPPNVLKIVYPKNASNDVPEDVVLKWEASDPDKDPILYDVFMGTNPFNMKKIVTDSPYNYAKVSLENGKKYYWKVVAKDKKGGMLESTTLFFSTREIIIDVTYPKDGEMVERSEIIISGKVKNYSGKVRIKINERDVGEFLTDEEGYFRCPVKLNFGKNVVKLSVKSVTKSLLIYRGIPYISKRFGEDDRDIVFDAEAIDDGIVMVGYSVDGGVKKAFIAKMSYTGFLEWFKILKTKEASALKSLVKIDKTGEFIAVGTNDDDIWILRFDKFGYILSERRYDLGGSEAAEKIVKMGSRFIVVGETTSQYSLGKTKDVFIMKINERGEIIWKKVVDTNHADNARDAAIDDVGNIVVVGYVERNNKRDDMLVMKLTSQGSLIWLKTFCGTGREWLYSVLPVYNGYAVSGWTSSNSFLGTHNQGIMDAIVMKLNKTGALEWIKRFGTSGTDWIYKIVPIDNGFLAVGGERGKACLFFMDEDFEITRKYALGEDIRLYDVIPLTDSSYNIILVGVTGYTGSSSKTDIFIKTVRGGI